MGLEEVKKGLEGELAKQKAEILREAEVHGEKSMNKAKEDLKQFAEKAEKNFKEEVAMLRRSEVASVNLNVRKDLLNSKKEIVDDVFEMVKEQLINMPSAKKKTMLNNLVKQAKKEIDVKTVFTSKDDVNLVTGAKSANIWGGVICESADGSSRVDLTFETMLGDVREQNMKEIAERLF